MLIYLLSFLIIAVLAALATAVIATIFLALGSALARVFAVSVWPGSCPVPRRERTRRLATGTRTYRQSW